MAAQLRAAFAPYADSEAGFVLTFGHAAESRPADGNNLAREVNDVLTAEMPHVFTQRGLMEDFHVLDNAEGRVDVRVYFLYGASD